MSGPPATITCVECGGVAHLVTYLPEDGPLEEGFVVAYACADCDHRHDLVWEGDDTDD